VVGVAVDGVNCVVCYALTRSVRQKKNREKKDTEGKIIEIQTYLIDTCENHAFDSAGKANELYYWMDFVCASMRYKTSKRRTARKRVMTMEPSDKRTFGGNLGAWGFGVRVSG